MLSSLSKLVGTLLHDRTLRAAGVLVGGAAGAQAIGLLALPLLTRLYSPEDFSLLAAYVAILTMLAAVTCMRLDVAIPLPESDSDAANLLVLSLFSSVIVTLITGALVFFFGASLAVAAGWPSIAPYLWLVPFGVGVMGLYSSFQYMAMRQKSFKLIAQTKITQAIIGVGSQVGLGLAGVMPLGLLLGHVLNSGSGVLALAMRTLSCSHKKGRRADVSWLRMRQTLHTYRRFPQYSIAEELGNNAGIQLPVLLIGAFLVGPEAGLLFLAMRAVGAPMTIVGGAVAQVYYSHAAEYDRQGVLASETKAVFKRLSRMLVAPMLALGPFAPDLFRIAFGPEWERAGVIVIMMLPWYAFRLIASPISTVMHVRMRQRLMLSMTLAGMALRVLPLLAVLFFAPDMATLTFSITSAFFYGSIVVVFLRVAGLSLGNLVSLMANELLLWSSVIATSFFVIWGVENA